DLKIPSVFLTLFAGLSVGNSIQGIYHTRRIDSSLTSSNYASAYDAPTTRPAMIDHDDPSHPDVYHIILDGYARPDVLKKYYQTDAGIQFSDFLKSRGFYVAEDSTCNYALTYLSLSSFLNFRYINDEIADHQKAGSTSPNTFYQLIQNNAASRYFQSLGYRY